jgi:hypothetical protein
MITSKCPLEVAAERTVKREECGVPEGIASIPWRSSCPLTGTCEMSSFSHNECDVPFVVNRMYGDSAEPG